MYPPTSKERRVIVAVSSVRIETVAAAQRNGTQLCGGGAIGKWKGCGIITKGTIEREVKRQVKTIAKRM